MQNRSDRLNGLVRTLDALGSKPSLIELASALEAAQLTLADVSEQVQVNPHNYNRVTVALRDAYEMLVMTWTKGQSSVPHDHGPSICAMLTVCGQAVEASYTVAADGYVDLEFETTFDAGQVTAGQDAAVHTVSNPGDDLLVTVHIYSPPLRDFRRFTARPAAVPVELHRNPIDVPTVAIVGGGFSGSITAAQLLRRAKQSASPLRVVLLEQRGSIGEGLAYSTREACHLLNVPAGRMSAWPDQPGDFLKWATQRHGAITGDDFVPRQWYGEYVRETLLKAAADAEDAADSGITFSVQFDEVRRIARHPESGWMLNLARGTSVRADAVVLAIGHRSPSDPLEKKWVGPRTRFIADPWKPFVMNPVAADDPVVILGTGLTAVDALMSLVGREHRGQITLVSRRGLLPQPHLPGHGTPVDLKQLVWELTARPPIRALELCRKLRARIEMAAAEGIPWQYVVDGVRPHIATLWKAMPQGERKRFLSHLRPFWEVRRHRIPVPVAKKFAELMAAGKVRIIAARVDSVLADADQLKVSVREKSSNTRSEIVCRWIVNATGPSPSNSAAANPAIGSLLIQGLIMPDELNLGVQTTQDGYAIGSDGQPVSDLFVVGTLRKPQLWESTAVPELRVQAAAAAEQIAAMLLPSAV
jgi:uncharacterized NAD(P)/FAD-binding protein YdhS